MVALAKAVQAQHNALAKDLEQQRAQMGQCMAAVTKLAEVVADQVGCFCCGQTDLAALGG